MDPLRSLVPMVHVKSVPRSIEFYRRLGFQEGDNTHTAPGSDEATWAWLESGGAKLMVVRAGEPVVPSQQAIFFYLYSDDVVGFRDALLRSGVAVGEIERPFWAPHGEFRVVDPDGFALMIRHA